MPNDNVRLALAIAGVWGCAIIVIIGAEAVVHDGPIAETIVDNLSKALAALVVIIGTVAGVAKFVDARNNQPSISASMPAQLLPAQVMVGPTGGGNSHPATPPAPSSPAPPTQPPASEAI